MASGPVPRVKGSSSILCRYLKRRVPANKVTKLAVPLGKAVRHLVSAATSQHVERDD